MTLTNTIIDTTSTVLSKDGARISYLSNRLDAWLREEACREEIHGRICRVRNRHRP